MAELNELEQLNPASVTITVHGREVAIEPIKVGQLPALLRELGPILRDGVSFDDPAALWLLIERHGDALVGAVAVAARVERAFIEQLEPIDLARLAFACIEVNKDFFSRQVLPAVEHLNRTLEKMGLPGLDLPSGSDLGPPN